MGDDGRTDPADAGEVALGEIPLHSTNLLTVLDQDGIVQYESPSIERIYGYDQVELVGEQVADYVHPNDREEVLDAFLRVVESADYTVEAVEFRHRQADGTYCWVEAAASTNPTPEGYYVVNSREITDRKEREQELERTNERLEQFARVLSHDLRNPLTVAQLRLDMVKQECNTPHLEDVEQAHERMETLIQELLTLARSGKPHSDAEAVDLSSLAASCWQTVATANATLVTDTERHIRADRSRLKQLLENLVRNAVEHGPTGPSSQTQEETGEDAPGEVTVTIGELHDESGFYVEDDGAGIDEDDRDHLFSSGYTTSKTGTGLGLAIVSEIASAHDWELTLTESAAGGARFEISNVEFLD